MCNELEAPLQSMFCSHPFLMCQLTAGCLLLTYKQLLITILSLFVNTIADLFTGKTRPGWPMTYVLIDHVLVSSCCLLVLVLRTFSLFMAVYTVLGWNAIKHHSDMWQKSLLYGWMKNLIVDAPMPSFSSVDRDLFGWQLNHENGHYSIWIHILLGLTITIFQH